MPDFDIDFCMDRREEVIRYVQEKYGRDRVGRSSPSARFCRRPPCATWAGCCRCRYGQVDKLSKMIPVEGVKPVSIEKALPGRAPREEAAQDRGGGGPAAEIRHAGGGAVAERLDPCRGRGDRGQAAGRAGAALPGPAVGHAGHPVQHEMGGAGGAGEVRLPRPQDADGDPERHRPDPRAGARSACRGGRHRDLRAASGGRERSSGDPAGRSRRPTALCQRQDRGGVPGGKLGHDGCAQAHEAHLHRGYRGAGGALPARADGEHPEILRGQERAQRARILHPSDRPYPRRDPGHHRLPGTGDADRAGDGGLFAWRRRPVAPRDGQEDPGGDGRRAAQVPEGAPRTASTRARRWRSGTCSTSSPTTASTSPTPPPMRWSATRPRG
jgi:hypothetical protein